MDHRLSPIVRSALLACCLAAAFPAAHAVEATASTTTTTTSTTSSTTTAVGTSATTEARLSAEFAEFLGGREEAAAVVSGLRQGTAFSLDAATDTTGTAATSSTTISTSTTGTSTASTATASSATIDPPTGTMGYGNVRITLRLAQAQLSKLGITQPTTEELSAVLLGGELNGAQVDGILAMRADGMGWGQIAKEYGMTVGQLMGKGAGLTKQTAAATTASNTTGKTGHVSSAPRSGQTSQTRSNGYIPSGGSKPHGTGIVSAAGGSLGGASNGGKGQAHKVTSGAQGAGAVSAGGQQVSLSGVSHAGGSKGMAPGLTKKN